MSMIRDVYSVIFSQDFNYVTRHKIIGGDFDGEEFIIYYRPKGPTTLTAFIQSTEYKNTVVEIFAGQLNITDLSTEVGGQFALKNNDNLPLLTCVFEPFESLSMAEIRDQQLRLFDATLRSMIWNLLA